MKGKYALLGTLVLLNCVLGNKTDTIEDEINELTEKLNNLEQDIASNHISEDEVSDEIEELKMKIEELKKLAEDYDNDTVEGNAETQEGGSAGTGGADGVSAGGSGSKAAGDNADAGGSGVGGAGGPGAGGSTGGASGSGSGADAGTSGSGSGVDGAGAGASGPTGPAGPGSSTGPNGASSPNAPGGTGAQDSSKGTGSQGVSQEPGSQGDSKGPGSQGDSKEAGSQDGSKESQGTDTKQKSQDSQESQGAKDPAPDAEPKGSGIIYLDSLYDELLSDANKKKLIDSEHHTKYNELKKKYDHFAITPKEAEIIKDLLVKMFVTNTENKANELLAVFKKALTDEEFAEEFDNIISGIYAFSKKNNHLVIDQVEYKEKYGKLYETMSKLFQTSSFQASTNTA